jgi:hypothetical protein
MLVMAVLLVVMFFPSFLAGQTLFSNDGPLGLISAQTEHRAGNFTGVWQHLNWIGGPTLPLLPNLSHALYLAVGAVLYSKWWAPFALLCLGSAAALLFLRLGFAVPVVILGGLAAMLNSDAFSHACWGLPSIGLGMAAIFIALTALVSPPRRAPWIALVLAGFAVGLAVSEAFDVGAILSLYVAAFVLFRALVRPGPLGQRAVRGVLSVGLVALAAGWMAAQALSTLVATQVKGVAGMGQDLETRQQRWHQATQWSLPKTESLGLVVAGLFGYRMDTPDGGNYWGAVGRDPRWDDHRAVWRDEPSAAPPGALLRHSGAGFYAGVLVVLLAAWAVAHSFRRKDGPFNEEERRLIWFWAGAGLVSLWLAFGRHAPFYQFVYALPYFSTIRNPIKFLHPFEISMVILFACGLQGLWRRHVVAAQCSIRSVMEQFRFWWRSCPPSDRWWTRGCGGLIAVSAVAWLTYATSQTELTAYLQRVGFPDPDIARAIARFSVTAAGWGLLVLVLSAGLVTLVMSGYLSGPRARWAGLALGTLLVVDLGRANLPWIIYYDYEEKYASNPVIDRLREKPQERRVAARLMPLVAFHLVTDRGGLFASLHNEWLEHHFQYYGVQSLDIIQMPRQPELDESYMRNFQPAGESDFRPIGRLWELTNTRWILGMTGSLDFLNQNVDPGQQRFRVRETFNIVARPGVEQVSRIEDLTVALEPEGLFSLFNFDGALPRAALFEEWEVIDNDQATLARMLDPAFDPHRTLLVRGDVPPGSATATDGTGGSVEIDRYEPKLVQIRARTDQRAVLLLNDRHHPHWRVTVNDSPAALLRCNHIMRGVLLEPGDHVVAFRYQPPVVALGISLAAIVCGLVLLALTVRPGATFPFQPAVETHTPPPARGTGARRPDPS